MNRRRLIALAASLSAAAGLPAIAQAQGDRTIRILVGFPPGGSIDIVARLLAEKMKGELKANVIVENRAGAGGRIAAELLKSAPADGSVLMITPVVVPVLAPLVFSRLTYNPATDFAPVGHVCDFNFALTVPTALPVQNVKELVAWLKANPQKANFGSPAAGSLPHFFGEMLSRDAKADMVHVPFAGGAALLGALSGNQVSAGIDVVLETLEAHRAGKVRVIGTSGAKRSAVLPDVPTLKEQGYPNMVAEGWFAMYAPARTPQAQVDAANRALNKALTQPDVLDRFAKLALEPGGGSPADLTALERASSARWAPVVKATGFRAD
ncbi:MAG: Bug family tripartite tricarboxylate transporter substrate binding protein [Burkholderiaceae bacterium]|jgi:tripartite-type tricarboxylate transporter receptor subunit TctC|nr:Bug family tripartite tricarboxylate transporter substrate binding protein [Burkholderiaceae bacterium]